MREINVKICTLILYLLNTLSVASVEENPPQSCLSASSQV